MASWLLRLGVPLALAAGGAAPSLAQTAGEDPVKRGEYIFNAAGCLGCHTESKEAPRLAGGRALKTPFGTFYGPNITPDPDTGIGGWTDEDFIRALREGRSPDGTAYFPVFPYTSFTHLTDQDLRDLKAYLDAQPAVSKPNRPHDVSPPFGWRFLLPAWQALFLEDGGLPPEPGRDAQWERGRYLVQAAGHCGECHSPRNFLGAIDHDRMLAGSADGPEGKPVPNITSDPENGVGKWSPGEIAFLLEIGMMPDGDFVGGGMNEVVENSTSKLSAEDREAIAAYLLTVPPGG
ncbi:cytochrome c [Skermanella mucosa]|uniref:cytochrome c n=1 Tax=Skermanella mucosa TaxID=1789672 RepID=UPI001E48FA13|nr:cytochrome c [Skermanella mucosa]UEM23229.1 cytochrome c [Skermanella mucosa]